MGISSIVGHILECCRNQNGSWFIQEKHESNQLQLQDYLAIFAEIKNDVIELMKDAFGNYIIQILIEKQLKDVIYYVF